MFREPRLQCIVWGALVVASAANSAVAATTAGMLGDGKPSVVYDPASGNFSLEPDGFGVGLFDIQSASGIFTASAMLPPGGLGFDVNTALRKSWAALPQDAFTATHSFGAIAASDLGESFLINNLSIVGSGGFGTPNQYFDFVYIGGGGVLGVPPVVAGVNPLSAFRGTPISHRFDTSDGSPPIAWENLVVTTPGGGPTVNPPSLLPTGEFHWQSTVLDPLGTYHFDVTATNVAGSDSGRISVNLLSSGPQPVAPIITDIDLGDRPRGETIVARFTTSEGTTPITWSNLVVTTPDGQPPQNMPKLFTFGSFQWTPWYTDVPGVYAFDVTATNDAGSDVGRLTVNILPPPPPVPPVVKDVDLGQVVAGTVVTVPFQTLQGTHPITWSDIVISSPDGVDPSNVPTLASDGRFQWYSRSTDVLGVYSFDVTATNAAGNDMGRLTLELLRRPDRPIVDDAILGNMQQGTLIEHQVTLTQGTPPIDWELVSIVGPEGGMPVNTATISEGGTLKWQTSGTDAPGTYHLDLVAANIRGRDLGHLIVDIVTEMPSAGAPVVADTQLERTFLFSVNNISHKFATTAGELPLIWDGLSIVGPADYVPVNSPTLSAIGEFNWLPHPTDRNGTYYFDVIATNAIGHDFGHLVLEYGFFSELPEPFTCVLLAPTVMLLFLRTRRRSSGAR